MKWPCLLEGEINIPSGAKRVVRRRFDGAGDVRGKALAELRRRSDGGAPWFGDTVMVTTPLGQRVVVNVPWPERNG